MAIGDKFDKKLKVLGNLQVKTIFLERVSRKNATFLELLPRRSY